MEDPPDSSALLPVTASLGPVGPLLRQLRSLARRPDGVSEGEIQSFTKDLEGLCVSLIDHSEAEEPSSTAKSWMSEVRELCYDTKNYLDDAPFILKQDDHAQLTPTEKKENAQLKFKTLNSRANHAKRHEIDRQNIKKAKFLSVGRWRRFPVLDVELIIDRGLMDTLASMLLATAEQKKLKVVLSLVGLEGVGKTTLAKRLYHQIGGKFQCRAFVRVSHNPDMRMILTSIFTQIQLPGFSGGVSEPACCLDAQNLITDIKHYLRDKSYLIIIDDLWSISVWDIIRRAFPDGNSGSRIITTTQFEDVASACCSYQSDCLFKMEPLADYQSRKLLFSIVSGSQDNVGRFEDYARVSDGIISKCGGLPLLIVNIASLLPTPSESDLQGWMEIRDCLPSTMRRNPTSEGIKEVLNFVYNNLSPELKTCLLYLAMYPEGYTMDKDDLVKQWVAEGFTREGQNKEEIARDYFDELVGRGMIQAVDISYRGVMSCTLHHMVHDLIVKKSMEGNFITGVDYFLSAIWLSGKARRLSVQFGGARSARIPESIVLSEVRSLAFFGYYRCADFIDKCKFLRVLTLHVWTDDDTATYDLSGISKLLPLTYLKIACKIAIKLPDQIQALQYLETLEVDATVVAIPSDIGGLNLVSSLKIAVRVLSRQDICILQSLPALSALSLHVRAEPVEMIVFDKGVFSVLKYFKFRCSVPWLKFKAGSMSDLRELNLCFNAEEADQRDTATISIEHLPGLKEITAEIWGADTFRTAISNHPSNPGINVQLVDCIFHGEDEKKEATDSRLNRSKRMSMLPGSSSFVPVQGDAKKPKLKVQTDNIEVNAQTFAGGPEDMANSSDMDLELSLRVSKLEIKIDNDEDTDIELLLSLSSMNKWKNEIPPREINLDSSSDLSSCISRKYTSLGPSSRLPDSGSEGTRQGSVQEENTIADIRIHMQPESPHLLVPGGCREDRPGMNNILSESPQTSTVTDAHSGQTQGPASLPISRFEHGISSAKVCSYPGCTKGGRGSSGRCTAHGGGRRCQKEGCRKGAEGKTILCKDLGGGRCCEHLGCTNRAEGPTDFCKSHGGGQRCIHGDCRRAARKESVLCIRHGGGRRSRLDKCTKSAEGSSGSCVAHEGVRRCQYPGCSKDARGGTEFCKSHGGGRRCSSHGCTKSVYGGTYFCVEHGVRKRCVVEGCSKRAGGRTDRCSRHGGGKRCPIDNCGKSARGITDFCKAHGGGCSWGSLVFGEPPCEHFASGKDGMCVHHSQLLSARTITSTAVDCGDHPSKTKTMEMEEEPVPEDHVHDTGMNSREQSVGDLKLKNTMLDELHEPTDADLNLKDTMLDELQAHMGSNAELGPGQSQSKRVARKRHPNRHYTGSEWTR